MHQYEPVNSLGGVAFFQSSLTFDISATMKFEKSPCQLWD